MITANGGRPGTLVENREGRGPSLGSSADTGLAAEMGTGTGLPIRGQMVTDSGFLKLRMTHSVSISRITDCISC